MCVELLCNVCSALASTISTKPDYMSDRSIIIINVSYFDNLNSSESETCVVCARQTRMIRVRVTNSVCARRTRMIRVKVTNSVCARRTRMIRVRVTNRRNISSRHRWL